MNTQELPKRIIVGMIRYYRRNLSPNKPSVCRYTPTCSAYALDAIEGYGVFFGGWMALRRILRCNPLHKGGYDPVPRPDWWQEPDTPSRLIHGGSARI